MNFQRIDTQYGVQYGGLNEEQLLYMELILCWNAFVLMHVFFLTNKVKKRKKKIIKINKD